MFILSKFVAIFLSPLLWIFVGLFFVWRIKNAKKKKYFLWVWIAFTFVSTNAYVSKKCLERYEMPAQALEKGKVYDCAVVLSGVCSFDSFSRMVQLGEAAERITEPVKLYKMGLVKKLLISGGSASVFPPYVKEAQYVRRFWIEMGVPAKDILIEQESRNTFENAKYSKQVIDENAIGKKVLLVTSALHMPRAKYIFNKMGFLVDYYPVDFRVKRIDDESINLTDYLFPKTGALKNWEDLIHEWMGLLSAKL